MISRTTIREKVEDLLGLELMTSELMKQALTHPESQAYQESLAEILKDELRHIELVKQILKRF